MFSSPIHIVVPSWLVALIVAALIAYYALGQWIRRPKDNGGAPELVSSSFISSSPLLINGS